MSVHSETQLESANDISLHGHAPLLFTGEKKAFLDLLLSRGGIWVPANELAARALQYTARSNGLRDSGYVIENQSRRVGRQVHSEFLLRACPGEDAKPQVGSSDLEGGR